MRRRLTIFVLAAITTGCVFGPAALKRSRVRYNEAVQRTQGEQLLLNLVRLRYRDNPLFLEVASVATQYEFEGTADISGSILEGSGGDVLNIGGTASTTEKPTFTLTPLQGGDFVERVLTPVTLETIVILARSGWSVERVLRLCANHMNGLDNASRATGPTPSTAPEYAEFAESVSLLRRLQLEEAIRFGQLESRTRLAGPIDVEAVLASDLIAAAQSGYRFEPTEESGQLTLTGPSQNLVVEFHPTDETAEDCARLMDLLGLDRQRLRFEFGMAAGGRWTRSGTRDRIGVGTRSLMGILFYLSNAVEIPEEHVERGLVTVTRDAQGNVFDWRQVTEDLLRVRSQRWPPQGAAVAVEHRGHWFYIDDSDLNSKSTFSLLTQIAALLAGGAESVSPVLTLPVGG